MGRTQLFINSDLSETIDYNTPLLPIKAQYCRQSWYANHKAPCHWHSDIECIYVLEGTLTYYVNERIYQVNSGQGIFINANRLHFCQCEQDQDCYYMVLVLNPSCLASTPKMETTYINPVIFENSVDAIVMNSEPWHKDALALIQSIFLAANEDEQTHALSIMRDTYALWDLLYKEAGAIHTPDKSYAKMDALKEMITFIQLHYQDKLTLADIAGSGMMCESKCCSLFKSALHQSPMAYLTAYRIRISLNQLAHTNSSITEIALSCGFNSGSYYTETFQKHMKMTPKAYRKSSMMS